MKISFKYIILLLSFIGLVACEKEELVAPDAPVKEYPALNTNGLDLSKYVSVGASFTAGFSDGALFKAAQESSFPALLATQFAKSGGGVFTQPLTNDNIGGIVAGGVSIQDPRLYFDGSGPVRLDATPTTTLASLGGTFNNMGVPGAKSFHMIANGYGNPEGVSEGLANPYYARFASSATSSMLGDALAQQPTFFTLSEVGGNDVLVYATAGGVGKDQKGNIDPRTYGPADITDPTVFANVFNQVVAKLTESGAKGVITTVPNITSLPFFTTVPNNALELDATKAAQLTGVFKAVSQIFIGGLIANEQATPEQAQALGAQYAIEFKEGKNRWIIDVPRTRTNPLGFRQMTEEELLLLTIDREALKTGYGTVNLTPEVMQILGKLLQGGRPTAEEGMMVINAVNGIDDKDALDTSELNSLSNAVQSYNETITTVAHSNDNVILVDLNAILDEASKGGVQFGNYTMTTKLVVGGLVSLDGIHLTSRGYGLMAYKFLEQMDKPVLGTDKDSNDKGFGTNFLKANSVPMAGDFPTNYSKDFR